VLIRIFEWSDTSLGEIVYRLRIRPRCWGYQTLMPTRISDCIQFCILYTNGDIEAGRRKCAVLLDCIQFCVLYTNRETEAVAENPPYYSTVYSFVYCIQIGKQKRSPKMRRVTRLYTVLYIVYKNVYPCRIHCCPPGHFVRLRCPSAVLSIATNFALGAFHRTSRWH
jgi:hypothetical protein